ncbi:head decoration protein [Rhodoplanes sp. SY1]|uniref:head decoration protein n=1 Tax=Rhodoplanes sp. SY1 TaxID=3166646 RepID=UPI0038B4F302
MTVHEPKTETHVFAGGDQTYCFEQEILAAGSGSDNVVDVGTVLGRITRGAVTVGVPAFTGTGNGTLTKANPAASAAAQAGDYKIVCVEKTTDSGLFAVRRPDGTIDGYAVPGTPYTGQVKFSLAVGATDFAQGDTFTLPVTVAAGSTKIVPLNFSATDGSQNVAGVSLQKKVAKDGGADRPLLALVRGPSIAREQGLEWPAGATDEQKAAGIAELNKLGIIVRAS